jgi:hypothetical protein
MSRHIDRSALPPDADACTPAADGGDGPVDTDAYRTCENEVSEYRDR